MIRNPLKNRVDATLVVYVLYSQTSARPQGVARDCLRNKIAII